uniref:Uncharacterized protein n=1 Tax=Nonomuraea gerenzanensis TaxID=93944 RepID=A0A1M4E5B5_9ACTN|nr:hypothetical protein BN4615_P3547 [Nonomuraea gerenzanensis]
MPGCSPGPAPGCVPVSAVRSAGPASGRVPSLPVPTRASAGSGDGTTTARPGARRLGSAVRIAWCRDRSASPGSRPSWSVR